MPKEAGDSDLLDDSESDDIPSDLEEETESEIAEEGEPSDEDEDEGDPEEDAENSDVLSLVEGSDNEDLLDLDEEVPMGLIDYDGSDAGEDAADFSPWSRRLSTFAAFALAFSFFFEKYVWKKT